MGSSGTAAGALPLHAELTATIRAADIIDTQSRHIDDICLLIAARDKGERKAN
jgi:hypothetical protein